MPMSTRIDPHAWAQLQAKDACRDLILDAADAVDQQDYAALVALFCEDAVLVRPSGAALQGRSEIFASYAQKDPNRWTHHLVCNHRIHLSESGQTAHSRCKVLLYVSDKRLEMGLQGRLASPNHQIGTMDDELVKTEAGWKIRKRTAWFDLVTPT
jgi:ketosteroid isomerase-like protein